MQHTCVGDDAQEALAGGDGVLCHSLSSTQPYEHLGSVQGEADAGHHQPLQPGHVGADVEAEQEDRRQQGVSDGHLGHIDLFCQKPILRIP